MIQNNKINNHKTFIFLFAVLIVFLSSCNPTVYLTEDESLLTENKISIKDRKNVESTSDIKQELSLFYKQRPNREFLFIPREWFYFRFEDTRDTSFLANWIRKYVAENPAVFSETETQATADAMQNYLRFRKGYYYAEVEAETKIKDQEAFVKYNVKTKPQFTVKSIRYNCQDSVLVEVVDSLMQKSLIKVGTAITETKFNTEKNRIVTAIQDAGYARFSSNFVKFQGDTSNYVMDVIVNIFPPDTNTHHKKYYIGKINVFTDHNPGVQNIKNRSLEIDGIDFHSRNPEYFVNPKILRKRIFVEEGKNYNRSLERRTSESLSNLNTYRFISLNPSVDMENDSILNYNFFLSPIVNRWAWERNGNIYLANFSRSRNDEIGNSFVGLGFTSNLSNRNLFHNAESFSFLADAYSEFNLDTLNALGITLENRINIPRLVDPTKVIWLTERLNIFNEEQFNSFKDYTNTELSLSFSNTYTATVYRLISLNGSFGYQYQPNVNTIFNVHQMGVNYLNVRPEEVFELILEQNDFLRNSLGKRMLTSFVLRDFSWSYTSPLKSSGFNWGLYYYLETSGFEISALNSIYNAFSNSSSIWNLPLGDDDSIEFAKYAKIDLTHRFSQRIAGEHSIAGKFRIGAAIPFGGSKAVPYIRQFFVGGQNSIRGWRIRDLGPGGYNNDLNTTATTLPSETGDFLLEASLEYRFPLVSFLKGAIFVDSGNIWLFSGEDQRENSQLTSEFYKQIAVASGFGLRLDLSYLILRFDFGYRIRNPYPNEETGSYLNYQNFKLSNLADANVSFGVNLPF